MSEQTTTSSSRRAAPLLRIAVYSDDRTVREQVHLALGRRVARDLPEHELIDFATPAAVVAAIESSDFDLAVLDAEAVPMGGMGLAHQLRDEIADPPPVVLLVARRDDAWLATWSGAQAISAYPIDPIRLPATIAEVLRATRSGVPTQMAPNPSPAPGGSSRHGEA